MPKSLDPNSLAVTELITGLDLVEWQLRIAAGESIDMAQNEVPRRGHAIEVRIYAENPRNRFLPSTGTLVHLQFPGDVRVDSGVTAGDAVSVHYDPMLAKMIAHGPDREAAIASLDAALKHTEIAGVEHNVAYLRRVINHPVFRQGGYTTGMGEQHADELVVEPGPTFAICLLIALQRLMATDDPWGRRDGFRLNQTARFTVRVRQRKRTLELCLGSDYAMVDGVRKGVSDVVWNAGRLDCQIDGQRISANVVRAGEDVFVMCGGDTQRFALNVDDSDGYAQVAAVNLVLSPMPGQVISVSVAVGDRVAAGDVLLVVEAMKMEHSITAPRSGLVTAINCAAGDRVDDDVELIILGDT